MRVLRRTCRTGTMRVPSLARPCCAADVTGDDTVDVYDVLALLANYDSCSEPEPECEEE
jgi:hypothetical protein